MRRRVIDRAIEEENRQQRRKERQVQQRIVKVNGKKQLKVVLGNGGRPALTDGDEIVKTSSPTGTNEDQQAVFLEIIGKPKYLSQHYKTQSKGDQNSTDGVHHKQLSNSQD